MINCLKTIQLTRLMIKAFNKLKLALSNQEIPAVPKATVQTSSGNFRKLKDKALP